MALAITIFLFLFLYFIPIGLWITARLSGVKVAIEDLVGMRIRKVPPAFIVNQLINAYKAGFNLSAKDLEKHYLAGGDVSFVIEILISANKANAELSFQQAAELDLTDKKRN